MNAALVSKETFYSVVHACDYLRGNRKRSRTCRLVVQMKMAGFDPERDICVLPAKLSNAFNHHPNFRFADMAYEHAYFIRLEDVMARLKRSLFLPYNPSDIDEG